MTINDNSTKSINAAIIDLQNQIKQLQHKIGILSKNQLKEDDIEFPGKVEYADEAGKAKEADHAKTADTAKYTSATENAVHAGYADNATKATQDGSGNVITDTYATKTELTSGLSGKADTGHTHTKSEITDFPTSLPANGGTADNAKKIVPAYTAKAITSVSTTTIKYIKLADCTWNQTGTMEVHLYGTNFEDTLIINYGGGNALFPMLCGYYTSNNNNIKSVIAQKGSAWLDNYSIWIKILQVNTATVDVAVLRGSCTINISETTTEPTNISEWNIGRGYWGTLDGTADNATKATQDGSGNVITDTYATKTALSSGLAGKSDTGHTHTKAQITDFPTSLPANGGTADNANAPTGFEKIGNQDGWGNQDGVFITDWQTIHSIQVGSIFNHGDIAFRFNEGQLNIIIDGVFYQNEGKYKLVDENSIKTIMKPNYTTGRLPAGIYSGGQTVSMSASITTTRGNPVFISYSGDFNSVGSGSTVPWVSFKLFVDGQLVQTTTVDNSVALSSDNTPFAGNALAVLSAGSHTIRLDAELNGNSSGQVQFQEQDNLVNLVAFEL